MRLGILFSLMLSCVVSAAEIDGPTSVSVCSGLVRLQAQPTQDGVLAWLVFPASLDHHVDGELLLFAAPAKPQQIDFAVIEVTQEPFAILTQQHSIVVTGNGTPDPDDPVDPDDPDDPPTRDDVKAVVFNVLDQVPADYIQYKQAVATNFSVAASDESLPTKPVIQDTLQKMNREVLEYGPTRDSWMEPMQLLAREMERMFPSLTVIQYRQLLRTVSAAIEAYQPAASGVILSPAT